MISRKFTLALAALVLLALVYSGNGSASELSAPRPFMLPAGSGDIPPDCSTLSVVALTPSVPSTRSQAQFQVNAGWWCNWTASSKLITGITPSQGVGSQIVVGTIPPNLYGDRTAYLEVMSWDRTVFHTAGVAQAACCVYDCTGVNVDPTSVWPPGAFVRVTVPDGWTWWWEGITPLLRYNCSTSYPDGVNCRWECSTIEGRHGYAEVHARGDGRACDWGVSGDQPRCPLLVAPSAPKP